MHTLARAIVYIISIRCLLNCGGGIVFSPFFSNGPAHQSQAGGSSCDEPPKSWWGSRQATAGAAGQAEAGPATTGVRDNGAPSGGSAEAEAAATHGRDDGERAPPGGSEGPRKQCPEGPCPPAHCPVGQRRQCNSKTRKGGGGASRANKPPPQKIVAMARSQRHLIAMARSQRHVSDTHQGLELTTSSLRQNSSWASFSTLIFFALYQYSCSNSYCKLKSTKVPADL